MAIEREPATATFLIPNNTLNSCEFLYAAALLGFEDTVPS